MPYGFWENSITRDKELNAIPLTEDDQKSRSAFSYGTQGYRNFHPLRLENRNPSQMDDFFHVVMSILRDTDHILEREEYWFFRADVNILMSWYRVRFSLRLLISSLV